MAMTNIAQNKAVVLTTGSVKPFVSSKAVDGKLTAINRWVSNSVAVNRPAAMVIDLVRPSLITSWSLSHMGAIQGWTSPDYNMADFKLLGSLDNSNWTTIDTVTGNAVSITSRMLPAPVTYRYVQLNITRGLNINNQMASVVDLAVNGCGTPYLSSLGVNANSASLPLNTAFAPTTFNYTAPNVAYATGSCSLTALPQDPTATVKINGVTVGYGLSTQVALAVGSNPIPIVVTAYDGTTQTYTLTVIREQGAALTGLTISSGALSPDFTSGTLVYTTQSVGIDIVSVTVTPTSGPGTSITVNGAPATSGQPATVNLTLGSNAINIVATNGNLSQTYTLTILKASSPYLASVVGIPGLTFVKTTYAYSLPVANSVSVIKVTPQAEDLSATVKVNNVVVPTGGKSGSINLAVGANTVVIDVFSASGGDTRKYTFTITRSA